MEVSAVTIQCVFACTPFRKRLHARKGCLIKKYAVFSRESEEKLMAKEALNGAKLKKVLEALEGNWRAEMEGHHTYQALADRDSDPVRAQVLRHLAGAEWEHASLWAGRIEELGHPIPTYTGRPGGEADDMHPLIRRPFGRTRIMHGRHLDRRELGRHGCSSCAPLAPFVA